MLYNKELKEINIQDIINNKRIIILFGASKGNRHIQNILDMLKIDCVFDNDSSLWGNTLYGAKIEKPKYVENAVVLTAIFQYVPVIRQLEALGIYNIYFYTNDQLYGKRLSLSNYFTMSDFKLSANEGIKYIHVIPDQKFVLPLFNIIKSFFNPVEHLILIYNLYETNPDNLYGSWEKYKEWIEKYHNIYLADHSVNTYLYNWAEKLHELDEIILKCKRIVFHGEWLCETIDDFFTLYKEILSEKAVWLPWSAVFGRDEQNMVHINKVLRYVRGIVGYGDEINYIKKNLYMYNYKLIESEVSYIQNIERPQLIKKKTNILVNHSCYSYDHVLEALNDLKHFNGKAEIYCITSYGDDKIIEEAKRVGRSIYGDHFHPIDYFMEYAEYIQFLAKMDAAYFAENIAAGYTTTMLMFWLGVKVYFKNDSQPYQTYRNDGFYIYDYYAAKNQSMDEFFNNEYEKENYERSKSKCALYEQEVNWKKVLEYDLS